MTPGAGREPGAADATRPLGFSPWLGVGLLLLAVPFDPGWFDAERARRGLLAVLVGAALLIRPRTFLATGGAALPRALAVTLAAFVAWTWLRCLTEPLPLEGVARAAHLTCLALLLTLGSRISGVGAATVLPALAAVVAAGLFQSAAGAEAPTATFGNLNVAAEFVAVAAAATVPVVLLPRAPHRGVGGPRVPLPPALGACALAAAAIYLAVNGTRAAALALAAAVLVLAAGTLIHRRSVGGTRARAAALLLGAGLLVAAVFFLRGGVGAAAPTPLAPETVEQRTTRALAGAAEDPIAADPDDPGPKTGDAADAPAPAAPRPLRPTAEGIRERAAYGGSTIAVRWLLWRSTLSMWAEAPWVGHGTGQFRYDFPPYRDPRELEISSYGRRFATEVETPHNDVLEVLAEGGLVALLLLAAFLACAVRTVVRAPWPTLVAAAGPPLVFAGCALARSPLGNAPAAVLAATALGGLLGAGRAAASPSARPTDEPGRGPAWAGPALRVVGFAFVLVGGGALLGQTLAGRFVLEAGRGPAADPDAVAWLQQAVAVDPWDPRLRRLELRASLVKAAQQGQLVVNAATRLREPDVDWLLHHTPRSPGTLRLAADVAMQLRAYDEARDHFEALLAIDPGDRTAHLGLATAWSENGAVDQALDLLLDAPFPAIRSTLASTLLELARLRTERRDRDAATRLLAEAALVSALDDLESVAESRVSARRNERFAQFNATLAEARRLAAPDDPRPRLLGAAAAVRILGDSGLAARAAAAAVAEDLRALRSRERGLMRPATDALWQVPAWQAELRRLGAAPATGS